MCTITGWIFYGHDVPVRPLLHEATLSEAVADPTGQRFRASTELDLGLDSWLRRYGISLEL